MSLFGDESPPPERSRSSLFAEEDFSGGGSLFADDGPDAWAGNTTQARKSAGDVARTLLTSDNASIPRPYAAIYDKLAAEFADENGVANAAVAKILDEAGIEGANRDRIWGAVVGRKERLHKEEVFVALAMTGLVGEGEDVSFDAVDDRRNNLPVPKLKSLAPTVQERPDTASDSSIDTEPGGTPYPPNGQNSHSTSELPTSADKPKIVHRGHTQPISTSPIRTRNAAALFAHEEDSPWGSPELNKKVVPPTAASAEPEPQSTPQQQARPEEEEEQEIHEPDDIHAALRNTQVSRDSSSWGGYGPSGSQPDFASGDGMGSYGTPTMGYSESPIHPGMIRRPGSFAGLGGSVVNGTSSGQQNNLERIRAAMKGPEETVTITVLPEKEGMFMFQHRNYQIASVRRGSRVVRRYSDFVWLLDCLHKRYPFRQLPLLPPKRLAVNGHYLSADSAFLDRRRRGLVRFTNALVRHPILSQEQLVIMFLTVPTELSVWRKQATVTILEEFADRPLPPDLEASLPPDLNQTFETVRSGLRKSAELYINLCTLLERLAKRNEGIAADYARFASTLRSLTDVSEATYAVDTNDIPLHNEGLNAVAAHTDTSRGMLEDEAKAWDEGVLEDLKRQRDTLVSMRELFDRYERLSDNIPQLERRIAANERKAMALRGRPDAKPGEAEKIEEAIRRDREDIKRQKERKILVRECVRDELVFFQGSQYHVSRLHQDWCQERVKYAELQAECWRGLTAEVEAMPLGDSE